MRKLPALLFFIFIVNFVYSQTISPGGTVKTCPGKSQTFSVKGGAVTSYQWQKDGANIAGAINATYDANAAGKYSVIINGGNHKGDTLSPVTVVVNPSPKPDFTFSAPGTCGNVPVNFTNNSSNAVKYTWNFADANSVNNTSSAKDISHVFTGKPGTGPQSFNVKLIAISADGCADSVIKTVTTQKRPDLTLNGTSKGTFDGKSYFAICGNYTSGDFTFSNGSTTPLSNKNYTINWGDGSPDYVNASFSTPVNHSYPIGTNKILFIIDPQNGCKDTADYYVYVGTNPAVGMANPGNTAICSGSSLTFPITGVDNNPPGTVYTVTFNDGTVPDVYIHPNVPANVTHKFEVTSCGVASSTGTTIYNNSFTASIKASNPCNSSEATIVPIYVSEKPNADFSTEPGDTICVVSTLTVNNNSRASSVYNGACTNPNIIWSILAATGWSLVDGSFGNDFSGANPDIWTSGSQQIRIKFSQPGVYPVKIKTGNAFCGTNEKTKEICVNPAPAVAFSLDKTAGCAPLTVASATTFNKPTCGENTFAWTVSYTPSAGCAGASGKFVYVNSTGSSSAQPQFQFDDPGVYTVSLVMTSPGGTCSVAASPQTITVKDKPVVAIGNLAANLCQLSPIKPTGTASCSLDATTSYEWTFPGGTPAKVSALDPGSVVFNAPGTANISFSATNACGVATATLPVVIDGTAEFGALSDIKVCAGQAVGPFHFESTPPGAAFTWTNDNVATGLAGAGSGDIPSYISQNNTTFPSVSAVTVSTSGKCIVSKNFKITVNPKTDVPSASDVAYCKNDIAVPLTANGTPGNTYLWYTSPTGGTAIPTGPTPSTASTGTTTYYVSQVSAGTQCEGNRIPVNVVVNPIPSITISGTANPNQCATNTGSITVSGLEMQKDYQLFYSQNGVVKSLSINASNSNSYTIVNLPAATYSDIYVKSAGCPSNMAGPVVLSDPNPPAAPTLHSNGPLCGGSQLVLNATPVTGGSFTFHWTGPNGFNSDVQTPTIDSVSVAASGNYFATITVDNCTSAAASINVIVNALPAPPSANNITYCINASAVPLTANGSGLLWYDLSSGGPGSSLSPVPATNVAGVRNYFVSQTDANGCESSRSPLMVTINPDAKALFVPTVTTYCPPFKITPEVIGLHEYAEYNSQYQWYINGQLAGSGTSFPGYTIPLANDSVDIKLVAISGSGCRNDSMTHRFFTFKLPNPSFSIDKNDGCAPLAVTINNTTEDISLYWYEWDFGNGQSSRAVQPGTISFPANPTNRDTTYTIKLKMLSVCDTLVVEKDVHVKSAPKALFTPDQTSGCSPMTVTFKNTSRGIGNTYLWDFGDGHSLAANNTDDVKHIFFTSIVDTFYVKLVATNECGSDAITYAIVAAPNTIKLNFALNGPEHTGCIPHSVALINNTVGASSFQWDFGDGNYLSTAKNVDTIYHTYFAAGDYTISLHAQNSCSDTTTVDRITVFPKPAALFSAGAARVCIGETIDFKNQSESATSFLWKFGDGATSVLGNPAHTYSSPGTYTITLVAFRANPSGNVCTDSLSQQVEVTDSKAGLFSVSDSITNCAPLTVHFSNQTRPSVTALWNFGDGLSATGDDVSHEYLYSGEYTATLTVAMAGGCKFIAAKPIKINGPSGKLSYTGGIYCLPEKVRFEVTATNTSEFNWDFGDGNTLQTKEPVVYYNYAHPGNYLPFVTLDNGGNCKYPIKGGDTIVVDKVDAGFSYQENKTCGKTAVTFTDTSHAFAGKSLVTWDFGDGHNGSGTVIKHEYTTTGDYLVRAIVFSNSGCSDTAEQIIHFHVKNRPVVDLIIDASVCANIPVSLMASVQSTDSLNILQWRISNGASASGALFDYAFSEPGTYNISFVAGTANGCFDTASQSITVKPSPIVKANADITICRGNSAQLAATGAVQYQWSPLENLSCTTCPNPVVLPAISTPYVLTGYNSIGCPGYDTVNVTVIQPMELLTSGNDSICIGSTAAINVSGALTYAWSPATSLSSTTISNPLANPSVTTTYRVIGYDGHHCFTDTAYIVIAVGNQATVKLPPGQVLASGTLLPLNTEVTNGPVKTWLWSPASDLSCNDCAVPIAHIKKDITYTVDITTAYGCKARDTIQIKVFCKSAQVFIPNAFTPDGDGNNDVLMVRASGIANVESFRIFNRWGQIVFERNNFQPNEIMYGWDGKVNGVVQPPGVYVYTAEVICENGTPFIYKGNTTILK